MTTLVAYPPPAAAMARDSAGLRGIGVKSWLVVGAVLACQAILAASLTNTAFQDEALYLYAGKDVLANPAAIAEYASYFSGLPLFYPVIGGLLDGLGGLELARALSTLAMLSVTPAIFGATRTLFGERAAYAAIAVFAAVGSVAFVSRLATYDALSLAFLAWAAYFAVSSSRGPLWHALACVVACAAAVAAKYAAAGFVPSIALLLLLAPGLTRRGRVVAMSSAVVTSAGLAGLALLILRHIPALAQGLSATTTSRVATSQAGASVLLTHMAAVDGPIVAAALAGAAALALTRAPAAAQFRSLALLVAVAVVPVYHSVTQERTSFDKHLAYAAAFAAPLAGLAIDRLVVRRMGLVIAGIALAGLVLIGEGQAHLMFYGGWGNSAPMIAALRETLRADDAQGLAQAAEVPRYYLDDSGGAPSLEWTGLYYFVYTPPGEEQVSGEDAYQDAVRDCYFDVVVLLPDSGDRLASLLTQELDATACYDPVASVPSPNMPATDTARIWRVDRAAASAAGQ